MKSRANCGKFTEDFTLKDSELSSHNASNTFHHVFLRYVERWSNIGRSTPQHSKRVRLRA